MKNFKSYSFWTALAGAVTILASALGECFGFTVNNEIITNVIMAIAGVLVVLGIVTMPKKEQEKKDGEEEKADAEEENAESEDDTEGSQQEDREIEKDD